MFAAIQSHEIISAKAASRSVEPSHASLSSAMSGKAEACSSWGISDLHFPYNLDRTFIPPHGSTKPHKRELPLIRDRRENTRHFGVSQSRGGIIAKCGRCLSFLSTTPRNEPVSKSYQKDCHSFRGAFGRTRCIGVVRRE